MMQNAEQSMPLWQVSPLPAFRRVNGFRRLLRGTRYAAFELN
jgi:hypothetical protein